MCYRKFDENLLQFLLSCIYDGDIRVCLREHHIADGVCIRARFHSFNWVALNFL